MGSGFTNPTLTAAVSTAGGLGVMGVSDLEPEAIAGVAAEIRELTDRPCGLNLLLWACEDSVDAVPAARPPVFSAAWPSAEQDLRAIFGRAHDAGALVMHMVPTLAETAIRRHAEVLAEQASA